jgi:hypothetical protein
MPWLRATASSSPSTIVHGTPTTTKYAVLRSARVNVSSPKSFV